MARAKKVGIKRSFLKQDELALLQSYCKHSEAPWVTTTGDDVWNNRTIPHQIAHTNVRETLEAIRERVLKSVKRTYQLGKPLYADSMSITRWLPGHSQDEHADRENVDGRPHPYPWRDYGCIIYLNEDYVGGELYFPQHDLRPKLNAGMLAFFPGNKNYLHGVKPILSGTRYSVALFLTHDKTYADKF